MKWSIFLRVFLLITTIAVPSSKAANILGVYAMDMKSHYLIAQNVLKELARNGHNVTVFTRFKSSNLPENYREVFLKLPSLDGNVLVDDI